MIFADRGEIDRVFPYDGIERRPSKDSHTMRRAASFDWKEDRTSTTRARTLGHQYSGPEFGSEHETRSQVELLGGQITQDGH